MRRIYLGAPAEDVWPWLVEPERVRQYHLAELWDAPVAVGDSVRYVGKIAGQTVVEGTVLEFVEGRRFSHTFEFLPAPHEPPSRVSYELIRYGDRMCCLELRHEGLVAGGETDHSVSTSWEIVLSSLKTLVETGRPLPWPTRVR